MRGKKQDIEIQIAKKVRVGGISASGIEKLVKAACRRFKLSEATVSITLVGDAAMRRMNKKFLNRRCTTDCLSFDLSDGIACGGKLFELIINVEKARREAKQRGHSLEAEAALYIIHALLHNLGFDDSCPEEAERIHRTEERILKQLGYGFVYNAKNNPPFGNRMKG